MTNLGYQNWLNTMMWRRTMNYQIMRDKGYSHEKAMTIIQAKSPTTGRTPINGMGQPNRLTKGYAMTESCI